MTSLIISIIGTFIAIASFYIVFFNHKKDKPKIEIYYDIMCNTDSSKEWIRVFFINIGRRATCIKSIGYFDWTLGTYLSKGGDEYEQILKEGEFGSYDIELPKKQQWTIKTIFVSDYFGNTWEVSKKRMKFLHQSAHNYKADYSRLGMQFKDKQVSSMNEYLDFMKKNNYSNTDSLIKKFKEKGICYD